jgi:hypothetical protein
MISASLTNGFPQSHSSNPILSEQSSRFYGVSSGLLWKSQLIWIRTIGTLNSIDSEFVKQRYAGMAHLHRVNGFGFSQFR